MNIRDVMTSNPRTLAPGDSLQAAARIMRDEDTGVVPIVENGKVVGLITDRDIVIRSVADGGASSKAVREIASGDVVSVSPDTTTKEAERIMGERQIRRLPVVENDRLVGIVSLGDIAVKEGRDGRTGETLENISEGVKKH
jgi:CBS domain-containing protein